MKYFFYPCAAPFSKCKMLYEPIASEQSLGTRKVTWLKMCAKIINSRTLRGRRFVSEENKEEIKGDIVAPAEWTVACQNSLTLAWLQLLTCLRKRARLHIHLKTTGSDCLFHWGISSSRTLCMGACISARMRPQRCEFLQRAEWSLFSCQRMS